MGDRAFISYAHRDRHALHAVAELRRALGPDGFVDGRDLRAGRDGTAQRQAAIAETARFFVLWSRHARASPQVQEEVEWALEAGVGAITPVALDDTLWPAKLGPFYAVTDARRFAERARRERRWRLASLILVILLAACSLLVIGGLVAGYVFSRAEGDLAGVGATLGPYTLVDAEAPGFSVFDAVVLLYLVGVASTAFYWLQHRRRAKTWQDTHLPPVWRSARDRAARGRVALALGGCLVLLVLLMRSARWLDQIAIQTVFLLAVAGSVVVAALVAATVEVRRGRRAFRAVLRDRLSALLRTRRETT